MGCEQSTHVFMIFDNVSISTCRNVIDERMGVGTTVDYHHCYFYILPNKHFARNRSIPPNDQTRVDDDRNGININISAT